MKTIYLAGSVTVFVLLMLGLIIGMYFVGYTSPAVDLASEMIQGTDETVGGSVSVESFINMIKNAVLSPIGGTITGMIFLFSFISVITARLTGGSATSSVAGSIVTYLIPIVIIYAVANIFFFPVLPNTDIPSDLSFVMTIVFNVLLLLAIVSWATGRD